MADWPLLAVAIIAGGLERRVTRRKTKRGTDFDQTPQQSSRTVRLTFDRGGQSLELSSR